MNEEAIKLSYELAKSEGYTKSYEDFKILMSTDESAVLIAYDQAKEEGYEKSSEEFKALVGFKKKEDSESYGEKEATESVPSKDFLGIDWINSIASGFKQGQAADDAMKILIKESSASDEDIEAYIKAVSEMDKYEASEGMKSFQKKYQEEGGDFGAFLSALGSNLDVAPEVLLQSIVGMASTAASSSKMLTTTLAGGGVGAATGAAIVGGSTFGVGAGIGAIAGGIKGFTSMANGLMETSVSMTEFIKEKLQEEGKDFNSENIRALINDEEAFDDIKLRSIMRGGSIAAFDLIGGGVAVGAAAKTAKATGKAAVKAGQYTGQKIGTKFASTLVESTIAYAPAGAASLAVEGVFGAAGETAARLLAGQELEASEIGLEGTVGAITGGPISIIAGLTVSKPSYKIRGQEVSLRNIMKAINDPKMVLDGNIEIKNNDALKAEFESKREDALLERNLPDEVKNNTESKERVKQLEKKIKENENKNTKSAQKIRKDSENEIEAIIEAQKAKEATTETEGTTEITEEGPEMTTLEVDYRRGSKVVDNRMGKAGLEIDIEGERKGMGNWYVEYEALNEDGEYVKESVAFASKKDAQNYQKQILAGEENWKESLQATKESVDKLKELTGSEDIGSLSQSEINESIEAILKPDRAIRSAFSLEQILGKKPKEVTTVDVAKSLREQLRLERNAAKKAASEVSKDYKAKEALKKESRSKLSEMISMMISDSNIQGKIGLKKLNAIQKKLSNLNILNDSAVDKYTSYVENVVTKADYEANFSAIESLRSLIKKKVKGETINIDLKEDINQLLSIPLEYFTDLNKAMEVMKNISNSITPVKVLKGELSPQETLDNGAFQALLDTESKNYASIKDKQLTDLYEQLVGESPEGLTVSEMKSITDALMEGDENPDAFRDTVKKERYKERIISAYNTFAGLVQDIILTGKDPFTNQPLLEDLTQEQIDIVKSFSDMKIEILDNPKDIALAVDMLRNFLGNYSIAGMEGMNTEYKGLIEHAKLKKKGGFGGLKITKVGRYFADQIASLTMVGELFFGDKVKWLQVQDLSGLTDFMMGKNKAKKLASTLSKAYNEKYKKTKPNGISFMKAENIYERGLFAFLSRNVDSDPETQSKEFIRRKNLMKETIQLLKSVKDSELNKMGAAYEVVYKKMGVENSITPEDLSIDTINKDAVSEMQKNWGSVYDEMSKVALEIRNIKLAKDLNYVSDIFKTIGSAKGIDRALGNLESEIDAEGSYQNNKDGYIYDKESGRYKKSTRPNSLTGYSEDNNLNKRFVSLDFEASQFAAFESAMVDTYTASASSQMKGFFRADSKNPLLNSEDRTKILLDRVATFVRNTRGIYDSSQDPFWLKQTNAISRLATTMSLAGPTQLVKQTVPALTNTLINAGPINLMKAMSLMRDPQVKAFIDSSGFAVAERGLQSTAEVVGNESEAAISSGLIQNIQSYIKKANNAYLKTFIQSGDSYAARVSFLAYYLQQIEKKSGSSDINFSEHKISIEAGQYAQQQLDRQQNISDIDLGGKMFSTKDASKVFIRRTLFPFANFVMNMKTRTYADVKTAFNQNAEKGQRTEALRSLSSLAIEAAVFQLIATGIREAMDYAAKEAIDKIEDPSRELKKKKPAFDYAINNIVMDIFSPAPMLDGLLGETLNLFMPEDRELFVGIRQEEFIDRMGLYGIPAKKAMEAYDLGMLAATGEYENNYGKKIQISEEAKNIAWTCFIINTLNLTGLGTSDLGSFSRALERKARKDIVGTPKDKGPEYY